MKKVIILFMALIATCQLYAQRSLTGTVVDADNPDETIIGATVKVMGTGSGTATDLNGGFTLQLPKGKNTIQVSYVGYKTLTMDVSGKSSVTIKLQSDVSKLNEVVVVGYGVMKRSDLTGSVSSIDEKAIKEGVNTSLEQAMQGRIAGVQVMQNSGAPGGGISVQIRGINSLSGNEPLYVVDGIAMSGQTSDNSSVLPRTSPTSRCSRTLPQRPSMVVAPAMVWYSSPPSAARKARRRYSTTDMSDGSRCRNIST